MNSLLRPLSRSAKRGLSTKSMTARSALSSGIYRPMSEVSMVATEVEEDSGIYMWGMMGAIIVANAFVVYLEFENADAEQESQLRSLATARGYVEEKSLMQQLQRVNGSSSAFVKKSSDLVRLNVL